MYMYTKKKTPNNSTTKTKSIPNLIALFYFQGSNFTTRTRLTFSLVLVFLAENLSMSFLAGF